MAPGESSSQTGPGLSRARPALARWISIVGHPLLLVPAGVTVAASRRLPWSEVATIVGAACAALAVVAGYVVAGVRRGRFQHIDVNRREQRGPVYLLAIGATAAATALMYFTGRDPAAVRGAATATALLVVTGLINRSWKVSLHAAFAAYPAALIGPPSPGFCAAFAILAVAVAWSRVALGRHTGAQSIAGAALGAIAGAAVHIGP